MIRRAAPQGGADAGHCVDDVRVRETPGLGAGRGNDNERRIRGGDCTEVRGCAEAWTAPLEQRVEARFVNGATPAIDGVHGRGAQVDSSDVVAAISQHCRQRQAEFAEPDNSDAHGAEQLYAEPMPFDALVGHHAVLRLLSRAIARETLPPALLFAGPEGIGKRRAARAAAEAFNCLNPKRGDAFERDACGECEACRRIARGVHPDVIIVEPGDTGVIKIEQIRDIVDRSAYRPFEGRRRVVIVDQADAMMAPAQSALLKTLEEPPSASVFLLITSMPDALLATVRSRCPQLRFSSLTETEVAKVLMQQHAYSEPDARVAAVEGDGSVGRALAVRAGELAEARQAALSFLDRMGRTADAASRMESAKGLLIGKGASSKVGLAGERDLLAGCLRSVASLLRDMGVMTMQAGPEGLANPDLRDDLQRLARTYDAGRSARAVAAVDEALAALQGHASPKIVVDWLALQV